VIEKNIGILGATSLVGDNVLRELANTNTGKIIAYSRNPPTTTNCVQWRNLTSTDSTPEVIENWLSLAPLSVLPNYFSLMTQHQIRRLVVLSSTSRFTKNHSTDPSEQAMVKCLIDTEEQLQQWAADNNVEWIILRPTLIYGYGKDTNISEIARFIKRFGCFPVFGKAQGFRQPIHADDVASACLAALKTKHILNKAYNIAGAEKLTYRDMVTRIFVALNKQPRLITVPIGAFKLAMFFFRVFPRYRHWKPAMAERMNQDLAFDYSEAERDLGFKPRALVLSGQDLPRS
jgi:nucleoside-diphosphate-sugar epimerase